MHQRYPHARVSFALDIAWSGDRVSHVDRYYVNRLNCWRDIFPGSFLGRALAPDGPRIFEFEPGELVSAVDPGLILDLPRSRINDLVPFRDIMPGRFYPRGALNGIPGVFKGNTIPFRCIDKDEHGIIADFNPPLAGIPVTLTLGDLAWEENGRERGGSCTDWIETALSGPGMQARSGGNPTRFFSDRAFDRPDASEDGIFYSRDRFVHHIDARARANLSRWYDGLLPRRGRVLDLMAGWASHLAGKNRSVDVRGVGLNPRDLAAVSVRGYPRPETDRYFPDLRLSDPVYGVCGRVRV